jgi:FkbM family methyltransferase
MIKQISFCLYFFFKLFNDLIKLLFKKDILLWFYTFVQRDSYISKKIKKQRILFFCPNHLIKFRVETLFNKEPETINWIDNFKKNKKKEKIIFWDVGANIGLYSIYSSVTYKNKINIVTFEPSTNNLRILSRNISINKLYKNISINQMPLGSAVNEYIKFQDNNFNEGSAFNNLNSSQKKINSNINNNTYKIFSTTMDSLMKHRDFQCPNYLKIDVDGNEKFILRGAKNLFKNLNLRGVLIEIDEKGKDFIEITKFFKKNKFKIKSINGNSLFTSPGDEYVRNYIFER